MEPDEPAAPIESPAGAWTEIDLDEGGNPACWAHEICDECGRASSEGHLERCSLRDDKD